LVELLGSPQLLKLGIDDPLVDRLGDLNERRLAPQGDQWEAMLLGGLDDGRGQLADESATKLDDQAGGAHGGEVGNVLGELVRLARQGDARSQHELAPA